MLIDAIASEPQFVDHLAPIWLALPPEVRGDFIAARSVRHTARQWGIDNQPTAEHPERPVLVASYGDHKRARQQGRRLIARSEHGAGQSYHADPKFGAIGSYAGGKDCGDLGLMLCPNEYSADQWRRVYPSMPVAVVGCPKLDHLPGREETGPRPTVCVSWHFDIPIIPETRWAWPTYRHAIPELAEQFNVIAHCHPKAVYMLDRHFRQMGIELVPDFADVCRRADLYVTDNSSTLFEFASTGRPVVVLNMPEYRREIQHGLRFWDAANVGVNVDSPADLIAGVELALNDPPEQRAAREAALDIAYTYRSGGAERASTAILNWLTGVSQVAA